MPHTIGNNMMYNIHPWVLYLHVHFPSCSNTFINLAVQNPWLGLTSMPTANLPTDADMSIYTKNNLEYYFKKNTWIAWVSHLQFILHNTMTTLLRLMDDILRPFLKLVYCSLLGWYFDFSKIWEDHLKHLEMIFLTLQHN